MTVSRLIAGGLRRCDSTIAGLLSRRLGRHPTIASCVGRLRRDLTIAWLVAG